MELRISRQRCRFGMYCFKETGGGINSLLLNFGSTIGS